MAKCIWIHSNTEFPASIKDRITEVCKRISPNNIEPREPKVLINGRTALGIMNPTNTIAIKGNSLMMGKVFGLEDKWHLPNQSFPEGSYALFREDKIYCEIVTDPVASRTIWYFKNDELFIASTSQRAITLFVGEFEFNEKVIPWMLSTGSLGPSLSWDKRIQQVPPDSSIVLNKRTWHLSETRTRIAFKDVQKSEADHEKALKAKLSSTFNSIKLDYNQWVLPLSGGYDSRGILSFIRLTNKLNKNLRTITWGLKSSIQKKDNDAYVAKKLAEKFKVQHEYFCTDLSEEPISEVFDRFLINGEGRIDHISAYLDGFKIWKILFERSFQGIIRGDEGFGWISTSSPRSVRLRVGMPLCSDYSNLAELSQADLYEQNIPGHLEKRPEETLSKWTDRLYHEYRMPTILAALADLKLSYVEQINPLLSRSVLQEVRKLPDHLRLEKSLFKKIVTGISPRVKIARRPAIAAPTDILKQSHVVHELKKVLNSETAQQLFPPELLIQVTNELKEVDNSVKKKSKSSSFIKLLKLIVPTSIKNIILDRLPDMNTLDMNILAFRMYIIIRMHQLLSDCELHIHTGKKIAHSVKDKIASAK